MTRTGTCGTCRHFAQNVGDMRVGQCRVRAPVAMLYGARNTPAGPSPLVDGFFPPVSRDIWCGEHATKLEALS